VRLQRLLRPSRSGGVATFKPQRSRHHLKLVTRPQGALIYRASQRGPTRGATPFSTAAPTIQRNHVAVYGGVCGEKVAAPCLLFWKSKCWNVPRKGALTDGCGSKFTLFAFSSTEGFFQVTV